MRFICCFFGLIAFVFLDEQLPGRPQAPSTATEPEKGTILLGGGCFESGAGPMIRKKLAELAGNRARLVIIPTADPMLEPATSTGKATLLADYEKQAKAMFSAVGFGDISILHTRNRSSADSRELTVALQKASAVWIPGGGSDLLEQAYANTSMSSELRAVLARGGVVAGDSAGAYVLAQFGVSRQRSTMQIGMIEGGLSVLPNTFVLVHSNVMRENAKNLTDIAAFAASHPKLLGISIDENTAVVIRRGRIAEILGSGSVSIVDGSKGINGAWISLSPAHELDLKTRKVI